MNRLQEIINGRTVAIMAPGKSIAELESHIEYLKDKDICWTALGVFPMMEDYILSKIGRRLEIVFDCATVSPHLFHNYELHMRLPRIHRFINRPDNNLWCTSHGVTRDTIKSLAPHWLSEYEKKIFVIDSLVIKDNIPKFMDAPNSVSLMIGTILGGGAKKIIVFGLDGYKGSSACPPDAYYHPEEIIKERRLALGDVNDERINRDTDSFTQLFPSKLKMYQEFFNNLALIYNCSPYSLYEVIPKINYSQLKDII